MTRSLATEEDCAQDPFLDQIDELKNRYGYSDRELSRRIGLSNPQHLAKIRSGIRPVPIEVKIIVWSLLDLPFDRESIVGLLPEKTLSRLRLARD